MRQEDLCEGITISYNKKPAGTKFKCPKCSRRMKIVSRTMDGGNVKYWIPNHNPKGFKKQNKVKKGV